MEIRLTRQEIIFFSLSAILVLSLALLWSALAVDTSKPWHPLSQIEIDQDLDLGSHNLKANNLAVNGYTVTKYLKVTGDGGNKYYMHTWVGDWPETQWKNPNDNDTYLYAKFDPNLNAGIIGTWNISARASTTPLNIIGNPVKIGGNLNVTGMIYENGQSLQSRYKQKLVCTTWKRVGSNKPEFVGASDLKNYTNERDNIIGWGSEQNFYLMWCKTANGWVMTGCSYSSLGHDNDVEMRGHDTCATDKEGISGEKGFIRCCKLFP